MKLITLTLIVSVFSSAVFGSADLDARMSFKNIVGVVLNSTAEPVHSDQVEAEMSSQLRDRMRFDFSDSGYIALKESLKQAQIPTIDLLQNIRLDTIKPALAAISTMGVKAAALGYIHRSLEGYQLYFYLVSLPSNEIMHKVEVTVENPNALDSFSTATKKAMAELVKGIPFDATVISREGYRVILDRGKEILKPNQQISAYTIEDKDGTLLFEETGVIQITQVEPNLAFGKVIVEKHPREITTGNKIRLEASQSKVVSAIQFLQESSASRDLANLSTPPMMTSDATSGVVESQVDFEPQFEISKGKIGNVGVDMGASVVGFGTKASYKSSSTGKVTERSFDSNRFYPQATVRGEIYLTSRVFFEGMYSYAIGRVDAYSGSGASLGDKKQDSYASTSSSMGAMRLLLGYRVNLFAPNPGPVLYVKGGYARQAFSFNNEVLQTQFIDTSYGGLMLGGGVSIHPIEKMIAALEVSTNIFPGVKTPTELPVGTQEYSGLQVTDVSTWELAVKASYEITKEVDFSVKGYLQSYGADFSAESTQTNKILINAVSENIKGIQAGLSYYF